MPAISGSWTLNSEVNGALTQGTPLKGAFTSGNLNPGGISQQNLILIGAIIGALILATIFIARRVRQYRKQLIENDEDIKYGHEVKKVEEIEKHVKYNPNPLATKNMDEMKSQLARNQSELERLQRKRGGLDDQYTIQQLQEQNAKLMKQLGQLKQEEQLLEADNMIGRRKVGKRPKKKNRKEWEQEGVSARNPVYDMDY
uniref:Uncharacterized protein n=2 Tax=Aplanochytrium stocchinoi TaxID=215587 RepID=A0A7S3PQM9_9STRA|mmetsp:Transcript_687/g.922  ORF Transcript_687/g.922 Transcript_687/m.922 type:complete len:200 (-) Transcript_687:39-638(-)